MTTDQRNAWTALISSAAFTLYLVFRFASIEPLEMLIVVPALIVLALVVRIALLPGEARGRDERDRAIAALAMRNGYVVLLAAIGCAVFVLVPFQLVSSTLILTRILALGFALSEVTRYATQVVAYRRA